MSPIRRVSGAAVLVLLLLALPLILSVPDWIAPAEARTLPLSFSGQAPDTWETDPIATEAAIVGLSWEGRRPPSEAWVRSSPDGSTWSDWVELHIDPDHGPDPGTKEDLQERGASSPAYIGEHRFVQYRVEGTDPAQLRAELVGIEGRGQRFLRRLEMLWRRAEPRAGAAPDQPAGIVSRADWGAPDCVGSTPEPPVYVKRVRVLFVHHTATTNSYTRAQARDIVRNICLYHVNAQGWKDIGYNFLIDRYGTIYEGRAGGMHRGVLGAHTGGFNSYSTGVAFIGSHQSAAPTPESRDALVRLAAWKLDLHHVDPVGRSKLESLGSSRYPEDQVVQLRNVSGHRDVSLTSCPGDACYGLLGGFAAAIDQTGGAKIYGGWPDPDPIPGSPTRGYDPAVFRMRFTKPTDWTLRITDPNGKQVFQTSGSGTSAEVPWDPDSSGKLPVGTYRVQVEGNAGGEIPRPLDQRFLLGGYIPPFEDDDGSVHEFDIVAIFEAGITAGCNPHGTSYCPHDPVSRWQMAVFLGRALGLPAAPAGYDAFSDDDGHLYEAQINALAQAGVTKGCAERRFCPDASVNRAEMAAFLLQGLTDRVGADHVSAGHLLSHQGTFSDVPPGQWYTPFVEHLAQHGITAGFPDGTYRPDRSVTRAQMATFLARTFLDPQ